MTREVINQYSNYWGDLARCVAGKDIWTLIARSISTSVKIQRRRMRIIASIISRKFYAFNGHNTQHIETRTGKEEWVDDTFILEGKTVDICGLPLTIPETVPGHSVLAESWASNGLTSPPYSTKCFIICLFEHMNTLLSRTTHYIVHSKKHF